MSDAITIREATPRDADDIARVHAESTRTTYQGIMADEYLASMKVDEWTERRRKDLEDAGDHDVTYVAEVDGQIVGWARGGPERSDDKEYAGELYAIYLLQTNQRKGIGRRLISTMAKHLIEEGMTSMLLWVLAENEGGRRFYEALGGQPAREQYITTGGVQLLEIAYGWKDIRPLAEFADRQD